MSLINYFFSSQNWSLAGALFLLFTFAVYLILLRPSRVKVVSMVAALSIIYLVMGSPLEGLLHFGLHSVAMLQQVLILMVVPLFLWKALPKNFPRLRIFSAGKFNILFAWFSGTLSMWAAHFISAARISAETGLSICGVKASASGIYSNIPNPALLSVLLVLGMFFLAPVFSTNSHYRLNPLQAVAYLFTACLSCSLLGLWVAFSAYDSSTLNAAGFLTTLRSPIILSIKEDQELAGMIMWVPGCMLYVLTSVHIALKWMNMEDKFSVEPFYTAQKNKEL